MWISGIPGKLIVATHVELRSTGEISRDVILAGPDPERPHHGRRPAWRQCGHGSSPISRSTTGFSRFLVLTPG
jgi:hypothetical protein